MITEELQQGNCVIAKVGLARSQGVITKIYNQPWGHKFEVQIVNSDGVFYDRGDIDRFKAEQLQKIEKINPQ